MEQNSRHIRQMSDWTSTKKNSWGDNLFSTVMVLSSQMTLLVSDMAVMKETMQQQQQSILDSTLQLSNQTVPFRNATPSNRPTIIRPTMFSPSSPTTTSRKAPPAVPTPTISSMSVEKKVAIVKYAQTTQISTDLVMKHSLSAADKNCDNLVHLDEGLKASDVLTGEWIETNASANSNEHRRIYSYYRDVINFRRKANVHRHR